MTVLPYILGVLLFVVGLAGLGGPARGRAPDPGQAVPRQGHPVLRRLRPHAVVAAARRDRVRPQGDPARRLLQARRDAPAGARRRTTTEVRSRRPGCSPSWSATPATRSTSTSTPHDHDRLFYNKPWWQRLVIMGSGVAINLVLAFVLFAIVFMGYGVYQATTTVSAGLGVRHRGDGGQRRPAAARLHRRRPGVARQGRPASSPATGSCPSTATGRAAGPRSSARSATTATRTATVVVERDGREVTLRPTTTVSHAGHRRRDPERDHQGRVPGRRARRRSASARASASSSTTMADGTWQTLKTIGTLPAKVYHVGQAALGLEERDPNGPMSVVGAGRVAGEMASRGPVPVSDRFFSMLTLLAGLNLFLGLINLVPLPPFDGGGIATTLYETVAPRRSPGCAARPTRAGSTRPSCCP